MCVDVNRAIEAVEGKRRRNRAKRGLTSQEVRNRRPENEAEGNEEEREKQTLSWGNPQKLKTAREKAIGGRGEQAW